MSIYPIDDVFGDQGQGSPGTLPVYTGQWDPPGGTCPQCTLAKQFAVPINASLAHANTWHSVTVNPGDPETTVSITFKGTVISAMCIIPPDLGPGVASYTNLTFILDNEIVGHFIRTPDTTDWLYNYRVFLSGQLSNTQHTFVIQPHADVDSSFLAIDYFEYEFEPLTTSSLPPTTAPEHSVDTTPAPGSTTPSAASPTELSLQPSGNAASILPLPSLPVLPTSLTSSLTGDHSSSTSLSGAPLPSGSEAQASAQLSASGSSPSSNTSGSSFTQLSTTAQSGSANNAQDSSGHRVLGAATKIGVGVGSAVFVLVLLVLLYVWRRRSRSKPSSVEMDEMARGLRDKDSFLPLNTPSHPRAGLASTITPFLSNTVSPLDDLSQEDLRPLSKREEANVNASSAELTVAQDRLQERHDEIQRRLSMTNGGDSEDVLNVSHLRREMEQMRAQIDALRTSAVEADEPLPSYTSQVGGPAVVGHGHL